MRSDIVSDLFPFRFYHRPIAVIRVVSNISCPRWICLVGIVATIALPATDLIMAAGPSSKNARGPQPPPDAPPPLASMGIMVGELTPTSAIVQMRLCQSDGLVLNEDLPEASRDPVTSGDVPGAWGVVRFTCVEVGPVDRKPVTTINDRAIPDRDFIARAKFDSLKPDMRYEIETLFGPDVDTLEKGPTAKFETLCGDDIAKSIKFVVVTGMNYAKFHGDNRIDRKQHKVENNTDLPPSYTGDDKALGYPALRTITAMRPAFFIGTGDNVYYDTPDKPRARTVAQMRRKWHEQFIQPRYVDMFEVVPTYWQVDDHDYRVDDSDNAGDYLPLPLTGRSVLLEQLPYAGHDEPAARTYRTRRVSKDCQIWLLENRLHRDANALPDTPEKSIWGEDQKRWLYETLKQSDATFKIIVSPTPMIGPDDLRKTDNHCDIDGFRSERDAFFAFLKNNKLHRNTYLVCGDRHWQYHAVEPGGIEEFSSGALVDANSRLARKPGDPKGTDPEATIVHRHVQDEPSGGFLMVHSRAADCCEPPELEFRFHDENGEVLYSETKYPAGK